jgi:acetyl esterase/lipase
MASTPGRVSIEEGVAFGIGGERELRCDVFTPPGVSGDAPAVLLVHGGGWSGGDRQQLRGYGILVGRLGFVCVACEYRLTGEADWPAQIHDVKAAIRWMRANSERLRIDPTKIAIEGNSAGGHLALLAAGTPKLEQFEGQGGNEGVSTDVAAAIGIYPPTVFYHGDDVTPGGIKIAAIMGDRGTAEDARTASPLTYVTEGFPPTLLIHGNRDEIVSPQASLRMYEALEEAGVPVEMHMYAEQPHAFEARSEFGRQCAAEMALFLTRYVAEPERFMEPAAASS